MDWTFQEIQRIRGGALYGVASRDGERLLAGGNSYGSPYVCWAGGDLLDHPDTQSGYHIQRGLRRPWIGDDRIYVPGEYGLLATSDDRGKTWSFVDVDGTYCMYRVVEDPSGRLLAPNDDGVMGSDDGVTWTWDNRDGRYLGVCFAGSRAIFFGESVVIRERGAYREVDYVPDSPLCAMVEAPSGALILCGDDGQLFRSRDQGETWEELPAPDENHPDYEDCVATRDGVLVVGSRGAMLYTEDDGDSWETLEHPWGNTHLWSVWEGDAPGELILGGAKGLYASIHTGASHDDLDDLD